MIKDYRYRPIKVINVFDLVKFTIVLLLFILCLAYRSSINASSCFETDYLISPDMASYIETYHATINLEDVE